MTANAPDRPNFLFDRQKVVIADRFDRERWERYFEPCECNQRCFEVT
jgi:hypothetical protein